MLMRPFGKNAQKNCIARKTDFRMDFSLKTRLRRTLKKIGVVLHTIRNLSEHFFYPFAFFANAAFIYLHERRNILHKRKVHFARR